MPVSASIAVTAIAIPSRPASMNEMMIAAQMINAGIAVASIEIARPWITLVPCLSSKPSPPNEPDGTRC